MLSAVEMADAFLFPGRDSMNVFEAVKENVTTRQAAWNESETCEKEESA